MGSSDFSRGFSQNIGNSRGVAQRAGGMVQDVVKAKPFVENSAVDEADLPHLVISSKLKEVVDDFLSSDVSDLLELPKTQVGKLSADEKQDLYVNIRPDALNLIKKLNKTLPENVITPLKQEVAKYVSKLPGLGQAVSVMKEELTKSGKTLVKRGAKNLEIEELSNDNKSKAEKLHLDDAKGKLRLFSAIKMLESIIAMDKQTASKEQKSSSNGGNIVRVMGKVAELITSDIKSLVTDIHEIEGHFKMFLDQYADSLKLGSSSTKSSQNSSAEAPQIQIDSSIDSMAQFKNISMVAMMSQLFVLVDDSMIAAGTFFLNLSKAVAHLQELLGPTINLLSGLASQMQTLLAAYQAKNIPTSGSQPSPWSSASNLGFSMAVVPGNPSPAVRTYTEDTSFGVYTLYPTANTPPNTPPQYDLVTAALEVTPSSYVSDSIVNAYEMAANAKTSTVSTDFPTLGNYVGPGQTFPTINALASAVSDPDSSNNAEALYVVQQNPRLLNTILGNTPDQSVSSMNTGFFVQNLPANLIALSNGSILSSPGLYPLGVPPTDPKATNKNAAPIPGNWSIVTVNSIQTIMKNLSTQMHNIQIVDNGAGNSSTDSNGVLYNSLIPYMNSTNGLTNSSINDFISNAMNPAATTLGSTQQDLSQFASKLVSEATQDILPLLQAAIQAWLKGFQ